MPTIDGLSSGLDTTTIINQLVALDRAPAQRMATQQQNVQSLAATYSGIKTQMLSLRTAAEALDNPTPWQAATVSSSDTASVTAVAGAGAMPGSTDINVVSIAKAHSLAMTSTPMTTDAQWATGDITLTQGGVSKTITVPPNATTGVRDLAAVVKAINGSGLGLTASAVQLNAATGQYGLQISSTNTGAASAFSITGGLVGTYDVAVTGQDAQVQLAGGKFTATSASNTFKALLPGVDVTVSAVTTKAVTLSVNPDSSGLANKVSALVNAANTIITSVNQLSAYDAANKKANILTGDLTGRRVLDDVTRSMTDPIAGNSLGAMSAVGVSVNKDGTLAFDQSKFLAAYKADPASVQAMFVKTGGTGTPSLCDRLEAKVDAATLPLTGYLVTAAQSQLNLADDYGKQIDQINARADAQAVALRARFATLESTLGSLKDQSNWLASQVAGLPASR